VHTLFHETNSEHIDLNMSKDNTTAISQDGLRYKSKQGGSLFGESSSMGTMSCYKCGLHKSRALGSFKKLLGQSMFVCGQCKPAAKTA
jgi:hypothetical protein